MIKDWKIAERVIDEALFNDLFVDTKQAISDLQNKINSTDIGPLGSDMVSFISDMEKISLNFSWKPGQTSSLNRRVTAAGDISTFIG